MNEIGQRFLVHLSAKSSGWLLVLVCGCGWVLVLECVCDGAFQSVSSQLKPLSTCICAVDVCVRLRVLNTLICMRAWILWWRVDDVICSGNT